MAQADQTRLARRIREVARLTGSFTLRSGALSDVYFDKYRFEADPALLREICSAMTTLVPPDTQVLAGLEMGGIPIVTVLGQLTDLPIAFIRKEAKTYGTRRYAEGADLTGHRVTLVEDVVSSGGALLDALAMLEDDGIKPTEAICVIDRETGGSQALAARGVELKALLTMMDIEMPTS